MWGSATRARAELCGLPACRATPGLPEHCEVSLVSGLAQILFLLSHSLYAGLEQGSEPQEATRSCRIEVTQASRCICRPSWPHPWAQPLLRSWQLGPSPMEELVCCCVHSSSLGSWTPSADVAQSSESRSRTSHFISCCRLFLRHHTPQPFMEETWGGACHPGAGRLPDSAALNA